ncbi:uncharacterized protein LOC123541255 [Mercenaria mercenaria]|uniref:uncharacterized protein LOC123541255 n=1 Tax=Mercenaria mercenaria TaxID=6596 RepID=UPI00234E6ADB|nr:uncharacterized protein LOC123541255 [Mercenaria mercenaria]
MFHTPEHCHDMSLRMSEVLEDIGINERMVLKTRKAVLLEETMYTVTPRATNNQITVFNFGSRSEATTTPGLKSDLDNLVSLDYFIVINDLSEWTPNVSNFLMIKDDKTPPGYCFLQKLRADAPLPETQEDGNHFVKDINGRILHKNTVLDDIVIEGRQRKGPSLAATGQSGVFDSDTVSAFPCKSWPASAKACLDKLDENIWVTEDMKRYARTAKCLVVGVGNKVSENEAFEWRVSTSLAERCMMFNLNITQIRCYILMKMILKTYINLGNESYVSSFMCKTVLLHCMANKPTLMWDECSFLNCLTYCLFILSRCILSENCPHFIIHENNLMAGKLTSHVKTRLHERMSKLIPCDGTTLFGIRFDDFGRRLQIKLNMINGGLLNITQRDLNIRATTNVLFLNTAASILDNYNTLVHSMKDDILNMNMKNLLQPVQHLASNYRNGDILAKLACRLITPLYCTFIGCLIASQNLQNNNTVSPQAFTWMEAGLNSDVASGRLKFASVVYSTGDMERAAGILHDIEEKYKIEVTEPVCGCYDFHKPYIRKGFGQVSSQSDVEAVKNIVAFCVRFLRSEIRIVPHELRYELYRSTQEDMQCREFWDNVWMDCVLVDSLPYLYFLQYKTYGVLQRSEEQQQALSKLWSAIKTERNLGHKETALNLLGQCMEQEQRPVDALQCYRLSLRVRERNNSAKIHICKCLANIFRRIP